MIHFTTNWSLGAPAPWPSRLRALKMPEGCKVVGVLIAAREFGNMEGHA